MNTIQKLKINNFFGFSSDYNNVAKYMAKINIYVATPRLNQTYRKSR